MTELDLDPTVRPAYVIRAYIGLGSNLDNPVRQVSTALAALEDVPLSRVVRHSGLYRSRPMGPSGQPDYVNAVAALDTGLSAVELLRRLQAIERRQGRVRGGERWGPRTLDLDLLLYGDQVFHTAELIVPHAGLHERAFVLYPLNEIAAGTSVPGRGPLDVLLAGCPDEGLKRLDQ